MNEQLEPFDKKFLLYKALKEKTLRRCREDSSAFVDYIFGYTSSPFHKKWHKYIREGNSGLILAFRGSGKTEQITIGNSLWEIGNDPDIRIKIVTETDDLAEKILSKISETILFNERYKEVFPNVIKSDTNSWNKHELTVKRDKAQKDPTIESCSILSASTGKRADLIHYDDVVGMKNSLINPGMREIVKEAFRSNWQKVLDIYNPKTRWVMTATPWHINDLVSELSHNKAINKAEETWVGPNFESPWPEILSSEIFKRSLASDGLRAYNRAYRGIAISDEETWINPQAIKNCIDRNLKPYDVIINKENIFFTGVDLGHREGENACPSVIFTVARTPSGKRIPVNIKILRNSSVLEISKAIINTYNEFNPSLIMVENNGAQKYLTDIMLSLGPKGIPIEGHFTGVQKLDPNTGVPSLLAEIETGQWVLAMGAGGDHEENICECTLCVWINEVKNYPLAKIDTVMSCWLALTALRKVCERANQGGNFSVWQW